ncbi:MAG: glycosyltransferase family 39 protein, partial [bacterium]
MNFTPTADTTLSLTNPVAQCLAFYLLFGLCVLNGWLFARGFHYDMGMPEKIFTVIIAGTAQIVVLTVVLGLAGRLSYGTLVFSQCAVLAALAYASRAARAGGEARAVRRRRAGAARRAGTGIVFVLSLCAASFALAGITFTRAVITPPPPSDAFIYHLTLPVKWMHTGSIVPELTDPFGKTFHPSNPETLILWLILPFHEDTLANLVSWFFWVCCSAAVYSIGRRCGAGRAESAAAGMLWLYLPGAMTGAASSEADHFAAFFLLVSCVFLLRYQRDPHAASLLWGSLALGIYLGSKLIAAAFAPPVAAVYTALILRSRRKRVSHLIIFFCSVMLLSFVWYAGNWALTGNPLAPVEVKLSGMVIFRGAVRMAEITASPFYHTSSWRDAWAAWRDFFSPAMCALLAPAWVFATVNSIRRGRRVQSFVFLLPAVIFFIYWYIVGLNRPESARYLMPAAALVTASWSVAVPRRGRPRSLFLALTAL